MNTISFHQGDDVTLTLIAKNGNGQFINLTGATLTTYFPKANKQQLEIANAYHTLANQTTNPGQFDVDLTAAETATVLSGENLNVLVKVVIGGNTTHLRGEGILTVYKASTHE